MTRSSSKRGAEPPQGESRVTRAHLKKQPPNSDQTAVPEPIDLKRSIVANWNLSSENINTCIPPEQWPLKEPEAEKWPIDIIPLLHQASESSKGCNELFQRLLKEEIAARQKKNRSTRGKIEGVIATDLKKVCKRLEDVAREGKETGEQAPLQDSDTRALRRGRSNGVTQELQNKKARAGHSYQDNKAEKAPIKRGDNKSIPPKRTASDLPLRPARKPRTIKSPKPRRTIKSPKSKRTLAPPVTPANPPEGSDEEDQEQENAPAEPVSGRHIYGDYIPPVTIEFKPDEVAAAEPKTRQTRSRKRGRAEQERQGEEKPTEVQIDSDPRDIDATGFLSELDPKEARRRRKPRLSRLQAEPVAEPAWSQDVMAPLETAIVTPATEAFADGVSAGRRSSAATPARGVNGGLGLEDVLVELLPGIPDHATDEERSLLEDRMELLRKDVAAYQRSVEEIMQRA
ncbi:hypothetical protein SVAN01_02179 [Stagonosporopsis vannaccii]|nr:hypothetical protein SVAN01_02179 [Stagonosporopsis vannaccii]